MFSIVCAPIASPHATVYYKLPCPFPQILRVGSILGLGLAYAGSNRSDVLKVLLPVLTDDKSSMEVVGVTAIALGLVAVGTTNQEVGEALVTTLLSKYAHQLKEPFAKFISLGLALTYLGELCSWRHSPT